MWIYPIKYEMFFHLTKMAHLYKDSIFFYPNQTTLI